MAKDGSRRPPSGRPPPRLGKGGKGPPAGRYPGGEYRGKKGGGGAGRPPSGGGGGKKKGACDMWIPVAIPAVLFYALPRMLFDYLRTGRAGSGPGRGEVGSTGPGRPGSAGGRRPGGRRPGDGQGDDDA